MHLAQLLHLLFLREHDKETTETSGLGSFCSGAVRLATVEGGYVCVGIVTQHRPLRKTVAARPFRSALGVSVDQIDMGSAAPIGLVEVEVHGHKARTIV